MFNVLLWMNGNNLTPYRAWGIVGMLFFGWSWGSQTSFAQLTHGHIGQRNRWQWLSGLCRAVLICRNMQVSASLFHSAHSENLSSANQLFQYIPLSLYGCPCGRRQKWKVLHHHKGTFYRSHHPYEDDGAASGLAFEGCIITLHPHKDDGHTQSIDFINVREARLHWCQELKARPYSSVPHRAHGSLRNRLSTLLVLWSAELILDWLVHVPLVGLHLNGRMA